MHRYEELQFWKRSKDLSIRVYAITKDFPQSEVFGLTSQMRRCAVSIPSNIAEGASRSSKREFARYLEIAMGSAYELDTQLTISKELGYLCENNFDENSKELKSIIQMMSKFKSSLK